jgi:hypothetical protein
MADFIFSFVSVLFADMIPPNVLLFCFLYILMYKYGESHEQ